MRSSFAKKDYGVPSLGSIESGELDQWGHRGIGGEGSMLHTVAGVGVGCRHVAYCRQGYGSVGPCHILTLRLGGGVGENN